MSHANQESFWTEFFLATLADLDDFILDERCGGQEFLPIKAEHIFLMKILADHIRF